MAVALESEGIDLQRDGLRLVREAVSGFQGIRFARTQSGTDFVKGRPRVPAGELDGSRRRLVSPSGRVGGRDDADGIKFGRTKTQPGDPAPKWIILRNAIAKHQSAGGGGSARPAQGNSRCRRIGEGGILAPEERERRVFQ